MKRIFIKAIVAFLPISCLAASANEFQQWMMQQQNEFQEYKDKRDKEFTAFLKTHWKELDLLKGVKRDPKPKPVKMPVAKPAPVEKPKPVAKPKPEPSPVTQKKPEPKPTARVVPPPKPMPVVVPKVAPKPKPAVPPPVVTKPVKSGRRATISFMGDAIDIYYDPKMRTNISRLDKKSISDTWSVLGRADYEPLVKQLSDIRKQRALNDWAFAVLVNEVSKKIEGRSDKNVTFLNWFLLIKAGYEARVAYDANTLFLLLPTRQALYSTPFFTFDGIRFYSVSFDGKEKKPGSVYTYDGRYPEATQALDMRLQSDMSNQDRQQTRKLKFDFNGKRYVIDANYDKARVDFLNTYPQLDLDIYFSSKVASKSAHSLTKQLSANMKGMSEQEAVNFLLRFVQTSLPYKTDDDQFGKENYLFPEETMHYRYSDCEDRSILFSWLVRELLGLHVIGLDYPGHVAAAVAFNQPVKGDQLKYKGRTYTITDPTYINASAGMTMPNFKGVTPKVISIN